jgi:hypothetical protein
MCAQRDQIQSEPNEAEKPQIAGDKEDFQTQKTASLEIHALVYLMHLSMSIKRKLSNSKTDSLDSYPMHLNYLCF